MKRPLTLALLTSVSLLLAACNGTKTPTNAVATVDITTTATSDSDSLNVKLNDTATFTAVAKAADGSVVTGKTVTWQSSNPDVASVDANGVVTAKRFGETTITASVDGVTGKSAKTLRTYGLEAFAGLRDTGFDTTLFLRYRTATGTYPSDPKLVMTITGPAGWNKGQPVVVNKQQYFFDGDGSGRHWFEFGWLGQGVVQAVAGEYNVKFEIDGQTWTTTTRIGSLTNSVAGVPQVSVTQATASSVSAQWTNVAPGGSYQVEVSGFYPPSQVSATTATLGNLNLVAGQQYYVGVHAMKLDVNVPVTTALSGQFDVTYNTSSYFQLP